MSIRQREADGMILVVRGKSGEVRVLWSFVTEGLWYFPYFYYIGICVLDNRHSYSIGRAMAFGRIGVILGLLMEGFRSF